jgi:hypothetical protein
MDGFMIDAVTGDTMGTLAFRRLVVCVFGCIAGRKDDYVLLQRSATDGFGRWGHDSKWLEMIMSIILMDHNRSNEMDSGLEMEDFAITGCS